MCIIAVAGNGKTVTEDKFRACFYANPDGFGMMWVDGGQIQMYKTLQYEEALKRYKEIDEGFCESSPIILHFRIGTQGPNDIGNCHPFYVNSKVSFCHNGILSDYSRGYGNQQPYKWVKGGDKDDSDTVLFNKDILKQLPEDFLLNDTTLNLIDDFVGSGNKLVFLDMIEDEPKVTIVNERAGNVDKSSGIWYSGYAYTRTTYSRKEEKKIDNKQFNQSKHRCSACNKAIYSTKDKEIGMCDRCVAKTCCMCSELVDNHKLIKIKFAGKEVSFCPNCLNLGHEIFHGVFDTELDTLCVLPGDILRPKFSVAGDGMLGYAVADLTENDVKVAITNKQTGLMKIIPYTMSSFMRSFEVGVLK